MLGKNNFKERLRKMENQDKHDRFSIRKLSIGAASVLIGFAFMSGVGTHTVLADENASASNSNGQSSVVETSNAATDANNKSTDSNADQSAASQTTSNEQSKADSKQEAQTAPKTTQAASQDQKNDKQTVDQQSSNADQKQEKVAAEVNKQVATGNESVTDIQVQQPVASQSSEKLTSPTQSQNEQSKNSITKKTTSNSNANKNDKKALEGQNVSPFMLLARGGSYDVDANWDYTDNSGVVNLTNYKGTDNDIYIPNSADFIADGKSDVTGVDITRDVMRSLAQKNGVTSITVSNTDGKKVKAVGSDWSRTFSNDKIDPNNQGENRLGYIDGKGISSTLTSYDLNNLDTSGVTDMSYIFYNPLNRDGSANEGSLKNLNGIKDWDTSNVTNMDYMFSGNKVISDLTPIENWNTQKVTSVSNMFSANNISDLTPLHRWGYDASGDGKWNLKNVTNMWGMFSGNDITDLGQLDKWDVSKVNSFSYMFYGNKNITDLTPLESWDTGSATNMQYMFGYDSGLTDLTPLQHWNISNVTSMDGMFSSDDQLSDLTPLASWDVSHIHDFGNMFSNDANLEDLAPLQNWKLTSATSTNGMFSNDAKLTNLAPLASWDTSNVTDMSGMFQSDGISDLSPLSKWKTANVLNMSNMFASNPILTADFSGWIFNTSTDPETNLARLKTDNMLQRTGTNRHGLIISGTNNYDKVKDIWNKSNNNKLPVEYTFLFSNAGAYMDLGENVYATLNDAQKQVDTSLNSEINTNNYQIWDGSDEYTMNGVATGIYQNYSLASDQTAPTSLETDRTVTVNFKVVFPTNQSLTIDGHVYTANDLANTGVTVNGHTYKNGDSISDPAVLKVHYKKYRVRDVSDPTNESKYIDGTGWIWDHAYNTNGYTNGYKVEKGTWGTDNSDWIYKEGSSLPTNFGVVAAKYPTIAGFEVDTHDKGSRIPANIFVNPTYNGNPSAAFKPSWAYEDTYTDENGNTVPNLYEATPVHTVYYIPIQSDDTKTITEHYRYVDNDGNPISGENGIAAPDDQIKVSYTKTGTRNVANNTVTYGNWTLDKNVSNNNNGYVVVNGGQQWTVSGNTISVEKPTKDGYSTYGSNSFNLDDTTQEHTIYYVKDSKQLEKTVTRTIKVPKSGAAATTTTQTANLTRTASAKTDGTGVTFSNWSSDSSNWSEVTIPAIKGYTTIITNKVGAGGIDNTVIKSYAISTAIPAKIVTGSTEDETINVDYLKIDDVLTTVKNVGATSEQSIDDDTPLYYIDDNGNKVTTTIGEYYSNTFSDWLVAGPSFTITQGTTAPTLTEPATRPIDLTFTSNNNNNVNVEIPGKVTIVGATSKSHSIRSMSTPTIADAKAAVSLADKNTLPSGTKQEVVGFVDATPNTNDSYTYSVSTDTPTIDTKWTSTHNSVSAYVEVKYTDADNNVTYQVVPVTLNIRSSHDGITVANDADHESITTHVGALDSDWTDNSGTSAASGTAKNYVKLTYGTGESAETIDLSKIGQSDSPIKSIVWTTKPDTTHGANSTDAVVTINFTDGSASKTLHIPTTVKSAVAKPSATTNHGEAITDVKGNISNWSDLINSFAGSSASWVNADGSAISSDFWTNNTDSDYATNPTTHARINGAKDAYIKVSYKNGESEDGSQIVWIPLTIKSDKDQFDDNYQNIKGNGTTAHVVNEGSATSYINSLLNNDTEFTYGPDASHQTTVAYSALKTAANISSIAWPTATNVDLTTATTTATDYNAVITFNDGSTKTVAIPVTVVGARAADEQTVDSFRQPAADKAKDAVSLPTGFTASSDKWVNASVDRSGKYTISNETDPTFVTTWSSTHQTAPAYVKVTYSDGSVQVVPVTLKLRSSHDGISITTNKNITTHIGALDSNWADSTDSASGTAKDYVTLKYSDGTSVDLSHMGTGHPIKSIVWTTKPDTTHGATDSVVTINFTDGSVSKTLHIPTTVKSAVAKPSATTNHGEAITDVKGNISNWSDLINSFAGSSASWVNADGSAISSDFWTNNTDSDHATNPTTHAQINGAKDAYIKVSYKNGDNEDGSQIVWIPLTIKSDRDIYTASVTAKTKDVHYGQDLTGKSAEQINAGTAPVRTISWVRSTDPAATTADRLTDSNTVILTKPDTSVNTPTGEQDVKGFIKVTFNDGSTLYREATIKVHGGYAATRKQSVQQGDLPTDEQAKNAIANNADLNTYNASYAWYASNNENSPLTTSDTGSGTSTPAWVKISYRNADGTTDVQWVQTSLNLTNDMAHQFHNLLSANDITVKRSDTPLSGTIVNDKLLDHDGVERTVVNVPANFPSGTVFSWSRPVDISNVGDVATTVKISYSDHSVDYIPTVLHVTDHVDTDADRYIPNGGQIWVAPNTQLDSTHGADQAKQGISNNTQMPANARYSWVSSVDTSKPGTDTAGVVQVTFADGSSNQAGVVVHIKGTPLSPDPTHPAVPSDASRYTPQGRDLNKQVGDVVTATDAENAIINKASDNVANNQKLPSSATISWDSDVSNITQTAGNKAAIVKVTYSDHSIDEVPIIIHVTARPSQASQNDPIGQDITTTVGDPDHLLTPQNGIANATNLHNVSSYSWDGQAPSATHVGDESATVKVTYADNSVDLVPILVHVINSTPEPTHTRDTDKLNPFGKTINRAMSQTAALTNADAIAGTGFPADEATDVSNAAPISYKWVSQSFADNALKTEGLKSGQVLITYGDRSTDVVTVFVKVTSQASSTNWTAQTIRANSGQNITVQNGVVQQIPSDAQAEFVSPAPDLTKNNDGTYKVGASGTYNETIHIKFSDGSEKTLSTSLVVSGDNLPESEFYNPAGGLITKYAGDKLTDSNTNGVTDTNNDALNAIANHNAMPNDVHYVWKTKADTSTAGLKSGVVTVSFGDGSYKDVTVHVNVKSLADEYTPIGQDIHLAQPTDDPLTGTQHTDEGIRNKAELAHVVRSYEWVGSVDTTQGNTVVPGIIKATYIDGSSNTVAVDVIVGQPTTTETNPVAKIINVHYGDIFDNNNANAKRGILNTSAMPSDAVYSFLGDLPTDATTHKINKTGNIPTIIHIVGSSYDRSVATVIHIVSDAQQNDDALPIGQNIETTIGDPQHKVTAENGIANAADLRENYDASSFVWMSNAAPDVNTVGAQSVVVKVNYNDGSSRLIPISVIVKDNPTNNPTNPQQPQLDSDLNPFNKTITRQKSYYNVLDNDDARVAIGFPADEHVPRGTSYEWLDPNFAQTALRTAGYKYSQVKVSYPDGSDDIVLVTVHVTEMADRYTPDPLPITIDPDSPGLPNNLNDPDNPNPAIDPNTLPSGTLVRFPDGVDPQNMTPGDHPTQVEVDYPDGTHVIVPTVVHVPDKNKQNNNNHGLIPHNGDFNEPDINTPAINVPAEPSTNPVEVPENNTPDTQIEIIYQEGQDKIIARVPYKPSASYNEAIDKTELRSFVQKHMPNNYKLAEDLNAKNFIANGSDIVVQVAPVTYKKLVLYIGRHGRIVKKAYITVRKDSDSLTELTALANGKLPKGYKANGKVKRVAKHLDVWVNKLVQPRFNKAPRTKDVLYVAKDGTVVKQTRITGDVNKLAKSKLPKGYKISGIDRVNNHYDIWLNK